MVGVVAFIAALIIIVPGFYNIFIPCNTRWTHRTKKHMKGKLRNTVWTNSAFFVMETITNKVFSLNINLDYDYSQYDAPHRFSTDEKSLA